MNKKTNNEFYFDNLLLALKTLTCYFGKPFSEKALISGLPIGQDDPLTLELLGRALEQAGLESEQQAQTLQEIDFTRPPLLLMLENGKSIIALQKNELTGEICVLNSDLSESWISLDVLQHQYQNICVYVSPNFAFSQRSAEVVSKSKHSWYLSVFSNVWPVYSEVLIASFLINLFALASPLFVMNVYDRVVPNYATDTLWVLASGIAIIVLFDVLLRTLRAYFIDSAGKHIDIKLSAKIFNQVLGIPMQYRPSSVGAFVNSVQGFEAFRDFMTSTTVTILVDLPFTLLYIIVIAIIGGTLAFIPILALPIVVCVGWLFMKPIKKLTEESHQHSAEKQATLIETIGSVETIKCEQAENAMQRRWELISQLSAHTGTKLRIYTNSALHFAIFIQQFGYVLMVIWGVYKIAENTLSTGGLIACTILGSRAMTYMSQVAGLMARYNQSMSALESLNKIMELPVERQQGASLLHREHIKGDIEFHQVTFHYPGQPNAALQNVAFKIKNGEKVGVIGRIGSGKSTLAKLLLGLYQPDEGMILLDQAELRQIDPVDLRHQIGYVPQDVILFYGTVKDNIRFGKNHISDTRILEVSSLTGIDRFLSYHPQGFELQVGERGSRLSGGQRQAIAIARALLEDPPILIFDEPTHSMDDSTEAFIREQLKNLITNKTFILVTHKSSLLPLVDRLIVMDDGKLLADGPKELVLNALKEGKIRTSSFR